MGLVMGAVVMYLKEQSENAVQIDVKKVQAF